MADVLPNVFNGSLLDDDELWDSCSLAGSVGSQTTVRHRRSGSEFVSSLSAQSFALPASYDDKERPRTRCTSSQTPPISPIDISTKDLTAISRAPCQGSINVTAVGRMRGKYVYTFSQQEQRCVEDVETDETSHPLKCRAALRRCSRDMVNHSITDATLQEVDADPVPILQAPQAFRRWVSRLRRRKAQKPLRLITPEPEWALKGFELSSPSLHPGKNGHHHESGSQVSSLRFVTAMRSATATLASASIATIANRSSKWRRQQQYSSVDFGFDHRLSSDSIGPAMDAAVKQRYKKRREKLEELVATEESYVADIKALLDVYFTLLANQPTAFSFVRASAQRTINEILRLHEGLLGELYSIVPLAECDRQRAKAGPPRSLKTHGRWHSVDAIPLRPTLARSMLATIHQGRRSLSFSHSSEGDPVSMQYSPHVAATTARAFASHISDFAVYNMYGANYELVYRDIEEIQRSTVAWASYDRAIEFLAAHVIPTRSWEVNRKKAMTIKDLLIKPIQRLPRYELLFAELSQITPVCDDPESYAVIQNLCNNLKRISQELNEAKEVPGESKLIGSAWLLGERLIFSNQVSRSVYLRLLGRLQLCGCLYVAFHGRDRIKGLYIICVLFETTLLLATAQEEQPTRYNTLAGISLANATIEETDNLRGLQCHTAPHSWKLVFSQSGHLYEMLMVACSAVEANVWRKYIDDGIKTVERRVAEGTLNVLELQSPMTSEMRSIGKSFGQAGSFVKRLSIHRTATVEPTTDPNQVIIKNTQAMREWQETPSQASLQILRSQSVQTPSHIHTLTPRRADRQRLEKLLSDVWTREELPYPGMTRRSDPIRASANHVMRKFSMASLAGSFSASKRTGSYASIGSSCKEDMPSTTSAFKVKANDSVQTISKSAPLPLVDFHNAPEAFLPADFELHGVTMKREKSTFSALTATTERPSSPLAHDENSIFDVRKAQSVHDVARNALRLESPKPPRKARARALKSTTYSANQGCLEKGAPFNALANRSLPHNTVVHTQGTKAKSKNRLLRLFA